MKSFKLMTAGLVLSGCSANDRFDHSDKSQPSDPPSPVLERDSSCDWMRAGADRIKLPVSVEDAEVFAATKAGARVIALRRVGCSLEIVTGCNGSATYRFEGLSDPEVDPPAMISGKFVLSPDVLGPCADADFVVREIHVGTPGDLAEQVCCSPTRDDIDPVSGCNDKIIAVVQSLKEPSNSYQFWMDARVVARGVSGASMVEIRGGKWLEEDMAPFLMDKTEVTVQEYQQCVNAGVCGTPPRGPADHCNLTLSNRDDHPMNCVNWCDAAAYCAWIGKRLPTSREWQWAARGRDEGRSYPWGEETPTCTRAVMWEQKSKYEILVGCGEDGTAPVGSRPSGGSRDGVLDMAGNVAEWVASGDGEYRGLHGGDWLMQQQVAHHQLRADAGRQRVFYEKSPTNGFRCVIDPPR